MDMLSGRQVRALFGLNPQGLKTLEDSGRLKRSARGKHFAFFKISDVDAYEKKIAGPEVKVIPPVLPKEYAGHILRDKPPTPSPLSPLFTPEFAELVSKRKSDYASCKPTSAQSIVNALAKKHGFKTKTILVGNEVQVARIS